MAQKTLLAIVQSVLNSISSDNVDSISDTEEALQIAQIAEDVYFEFINGRELPHLRELIRLNASGDSTKPSHMKIPDSVQYCIEVRYNKKTSLSNPDEFKKVTWLEPEDFIAIVMERDSTADEVDSVTDYGGTTIFIYNDRAPTYYTSFDDEYLVFDSYDSDLDATLQASKSQAFVYKEPTFSQTDGHVIDMPDKDFPYFLAQLRAIVWNDIANTPNASAERRARKLEVYSNNNKWRNAGGIRRTFNNGRS